MFSVKKKAFLGKKSYLFQENLSDSRVTFLNEDKSSYIKENFCSKINFLV